MIAAYFPFTYVSDVEIKKINSVFGKISIYQPVTGLSTCFSTQFSIDELIDIKLPIVDCDDEIKMAMSDYLNWIYANSGRERIDKNFVRTVLAGTIPFYDETSISSIQQEIKDNGNFNFDINSTDILFRARLFLTLAHYSDLQKDQSNLEFKNFKDKEKLLMRILKDRLVEKHVHTTDESIIEEKVFGSFMCAERIKAWTTIVLKGKDLPDFLITDSHSSVESLFDAIEFESNFFKLGSMFVPYSKNICTGNPELLEIIEKLLFQYDPKKLNISCFRDMSDLHIKKNNSLVTLYLLPGMSLELLLNKIAFDGFTESMVRKKDEGICNFIIAYVS